MARFSAEDRETIWNMREAGVPVKCIAKHLDRQICHSQIHRRPWRQEAHSSKTLGAPPITRGT